MMRSLIVGASRIAGATLLIALSSACSGSSAGTGSQVNGNGTGASVGAGGFGGSSSSGGGAPSSGGFPVSSGSGGSPIVSGSGGSAGFSTGGAGESGGTGTSESGGAAAGGDGGAGNGGTTSVPDAGSGGASDADGGAHYPPRPDQGVGDGTDVVLLGDSWMSNTLEIEGTGGGIAPALVQVAMKPYRNYAVQGVMLLMADSFGPAIPTQYTAAKAANPDIKTVVMTAGGNDIIQNPTLQASCQMGTDQCKQLLIQIGQALNTLWTQMATDGVQDIVYIQYAADVGTVSPSLRGDKGVPPPTICTSGKVRCYSVDTTDAVMMQIAADGIHPLQAANTRIAQVVYALMQKEGMRR